MDGRRWKERRHARRLPRTCDVRPAIGIGTLASIVRWYAGMAPNYRALSYWHDSLGEEITPRAALAGERRADVAIVGAGYTGLWTAYYLKKASPGLDVAIVEAEVAGFGASGRNGGWCVGLIAGNERWLATPAHREGGLKLARAMFDTVAEVGRVTGAEGIACDYARGGTISIATSAPQLRLLRHRLDEMRSLGFGEEDYRWLEPDECRARVSTRANLGGL